MGSEIEIVVEEVAQDSDTCLIKTSRAVASTPEYFSTVEEAQQSPLGRQLLEIGGLEAVLMQDRTITLLKPVPGEPWGRIAEAAKRVIEEHFADLDRIHSTQAREMNEEEKALFIQIQNLLNEEINPMVASHGGFIEVHDVKEKDVFIHMGGGCQGCGMAAATLRQGVESLLREKVPQIQAIHDSTDHASGENPYYASGSM